MSKFHFLGLLANVDSSILPVKLQNGFEVTVIPIDQIRDFLSLLLGSTRLAIRRKLFMDFHCVEPFQRKVYAVKNSFEATVNEKGISEEVTKFENNLINGYLYLVLRLMRLFKSGNIIMPCHYIYHVGEDNKPQFYMSAEWDKQIVLDKYHLDKDELPELQEFIQKTKLPFSMPFLELAFQNFELSYETSVLNLSFLTLVISLETLLNRGSDELRYSLSRNTASLLGRNKEQFTRIFNEVRDLYDKRSKIVHTGRSDIIVLEDIQRMRHYVRESIN